MYTVHDHVMAEKLGSHDYFLSVIADQNNINLRRMSEQADRLASETGKQHKVVLYANYTLGINPANVLCSGYSVYQTEVC